LHQRAPFTPEKFTAMSKDTEPIVTVHNLKKQKIVLPASLRFAAAYKKL
jgi:hypothetical protein